MSASFQFVVGGTYILVASSGAGDGPGTKGCAEGGVPSPFAGLDVLALAGVPQRGQLVRAGESGHPHWEHLMLVPIPFTE